MLYLAPFMMPAKLAIERRMASNATSRPSRRAIAKTLTALLTARCGDSLAAVG